MILSWFFAAGVDLLAMHSTSHACYFLRVEFPEAKLLLKWVSLWFPCWFGFTYNRGNSRLTKLGSGTCYLIIYLSLLLRWHSTYLHAK